METEPREKGDPPPAASATEFHDPVRLQLDLRRPLRAGQPGVIALRVENRIRLPVTLELALEDDRFAPVVESAELGLGKPRVRLAPGEKGAANLPCLCPKQAGHYVLGPLHARISFRDRIEEKELLLLDCRVPGGTIVLPIEEPLAGTRPLHVEVHGDMLGSELKLEDPSKAQGGSLEPLPLVPTEPIAGHQPLGRDAAWPTVWAVRGDSSCGFDRQFLFFGDRVRFGRRVDDEQEELRFALRWQPTASIDLAEAERRSETLHRDAGTILYQESSESWCLEAAPKVVYLQVGDRLVQDRARVQLDDEAEILLGHGEGRFEVRSRDRLFEGYEEPLSWNLLGGPPAALPAAGSAGLLLRRTTNGSGDSYYVFRSHWSAGSSSDDDLPVSGWPARALQLVGLAGAEQRLALLSLLPAELGWVDVDGVRVERGVLTELSAGGRISVWRSSGQRVLSIEPIQKGETKTWVGASKEDDQELVSADERKRSAQAERDPSASATRRVYEALRSGILDFGSGAVSASPLEGGDSCARVHLKTFRLLSHLRHGVAETSLHGISLLGSRLETGNSRVLERLLEAADGLGESAREIEQFLGEKVEGVRVCEVLSDGGENLRARLKELLAAKEELEELPSPSTARCVAFAARALVVCFDELRTSLLARRRDLRALLESALERERPQLEESGIELRYEPAGVDTWLFLDEEPVARCLSELLRNAVTHTAAEEPSKKNGSGRPFVSIDLDEASDLGEHVRLTVENGPVRHSSREREGYRPSTGEGQKMLREIVESTHLGKLAIHDSSPESYRVEILWRRRLPMS